MPRDIDVVGVWHGTPYQVASVSSTADGVIVACGPAGKHTTRPKTGHHRHTKDPGAGGRPRTARARGSAGSRRRSHRRDQAVRHRAPAVSPVRAERTHVDGAV